MILGDAVRLRDYLKITKYTGAFLEKGVSNDPGLYEGFFDNGIITYDFSEEGAVENTYWFDDDKTLTTLKSKAIRKIFLWGNYQKKTS